MVVVRVLFGGGGEGIVMVEVRVLCGYVMV